MRQLTLLLPPRPQLTRAAAGRRLPALEIALARGDAIAPAAGDDPLLGHLVRIRPTPWPIAALTRQLDAGDAGTALWLRADPAHLAAGRTGARLMAVGGLALAPGDCAEIERSLKPLFGDEGFEFSAPRPERWYLRALAGARLPRFATPADALGADLRGHLPIGEHAARWIRLGNEAQVVLHQHPVNAARARRGEPAVNCLWFWGPGPAPAEVEAGFDAVRSHDSVLRAIAHAKGRDAAGPDAAVPPTLDTVVIDRRGEADPQALEAVQVGPALAALRAGRLAELRLLFADGMGVVLRPAHHWRYWRRPRALA